MLSRVWLAFLLAALCWTGPVLAQSTTLEVDDSLTWLRARAGFGGALLVSPDQTGKLGYKGAGFEFEAEIGAAVLPWLELHGGLLGGMFGAEGGGTMGGLLAPLGGVRALVPVKKYLPYTTFQMGPGFTGNEIRPLLRFGLGFDVRVSRWLTLGPRIGYFNLLPLKEKWATSGARAIEFSLSLGFHPVPVEVKRSVVERRTVQVVRQLPPPPPPPPMPLPDPEPDEVVLRLLEQALPATQQELLAPVLFQFDSAELEPNGVAMLHEVARALGERPEIALVEVRGYADERGKSEYNDALSERRAQTVQQWLVEHGVAPERLQVAGRGATEPVEAGGTEANYQQNRRVVFRILRMEEKP